MTQEQRQRMFKESVKTLDDLVDLINIRKKTGQVSNEFNQFYLFILLLICDAHVLIKLYCKADQRWEEIFLVKQMYIFINESTKKIIGFEKETENLKNKIYWNEKLRMFVGEQYPSLLPEFEKISNILIAYRDNDSQDDIWDLRKLAVHYDKELDTENYFKTLNEMNVDDSFQHFCKWLGIIYPLLHFAQKIITSK